MFEHDQCRGIPRTNIDKKTGTRVIGVSGCIGKTTTSHAIWDSLNSIESNSALLFDRTRTTFLGLAIDILRSVISQKYLVVELQSDGPGQIPKLLEVAPPAISVVTRITHAHYEKLGSLDEILKEETSALVLPQFRKGITAIINGDDDLLANLNCEDWGKRISFGRSLGCDPEIVDSEIVGNRTNVRLCSNRQPIEFSVGCAGAHYPYVFAATFAVLKELGLQEDNIVGLFRNVVASLEEWKLFEEETVTLYW